MEKTYIKLLNSKAVTVKKGCFLYSSWRHNYRKQSKVYCHQVALMKKLGSTSLPIGFHSSHLCHNPNCINPDHLSLESNSVNQNRVWCQRHRECRGHAQYVECILNNWLMPLLFVVFCLIWPYVTQSGVIYLSVSVFDKFCECEWIRFNVTFMIYCLLYNSECSKYDT